MQRMLATCLVLALATVTGCAKDGETETALAVSVKTDLLVGQELSSVWIRVFSADADPKTAMPLQDFEPQPATALDKVVLVEKGVANELLIAVQGLGPAGRSQPVVEHHVRARFSPGRTMVVPVYLAKGCVQKVCGAPGQTCVGGTTPSGSCGTCGPVPEAAAVAVEESRDVTASWQPTPCPVGPAPEPPPGPVCDGGVRDGGLSDGGMCPAPCTPSPFPGSTCNLVEQCGCGEGTSCQAVETSGGTIVAQCKAVPGTRSVRESCSASELCGPGLECIGPKDESIDDTYICRPYCEIDSDCGASGSCQEILPSSGRAPGYKVCFSTCRRDADCESKCCDEGLCAPAGFCSTPTPPPPPAPCKALGVTCSASSDCCDAAPYCLTNSSGQKTCQATVVVQPEICQPAASDSQCFACYAPKCCAQMTACYRSPACQAVLNCESRCPSGGTETACIAACQRANATGGPLSAAWDTCIDTSCASQCGG